MGIRLISNSLYYWSLIFTCLRSYSKKLVLRVSLGFQTLENNKSTRPAASCFQMFSRVWNPNETLALVFEILRLGGEISVLDKLTLLYISIFIQNVYLLA